MPPLLLQPLTLRDATLRNRIVVSPMCMYSAVDGLPTEWHRVHLGMLATGGAGMVITEATAVVPEGRITHGDLGLWSDAHMEALKPIVAFMRSQGTVPAIQLGHAGRKASMQRPWHGNGALDATDAARGELPWPIVGPTAEPVGPGALEPHALTVAEIGALRTAFATAAARAVATGFGAIEIHGAHGYLTHTFLSPLANRRNDAYGGDLAGRMRFALELATAVREAIPVGMPLLFRISSIDAPGVGWQLEDSVALARELKARGVDVIDCSSGGIAGPATAALVPRHPGFQVPFAARIKREAGIMTQTVGLILEPAQAEAILQSGDADLIAIGREALRDPFWPRHAAEALGVPTDYADWPPQYGWWLQRRAQSLAMGRAERERGGAAS